MRKKLAILLPLSIFALIACVNENPGSSNVSGSQTLPESSLVSGTSGSSDDQGLSSSLSSNNQSSNSTLSNSSLSESLGVSSETLVQNNKLPFSSLEALFNTAFNAEARETSSINIKNTTKTMNSSTEKNEVFKLFTNNTSASEGTYVKKTDDAITAQTTFKTRKNVVTDRIEANGSINSYSMFATVVDYEDNSINGCDDVASKVYVLNSEQEATLSGLGEGMYVLNKDILKESSASCIPTLYEFIGTQILSNPYASQTNIDSFDVTKDDKNNNVYTCNVEYNYEGDLNDIKYFQIHIQFVMDSENKKMLNTSYSISERDVSKTDSENDVYTTETSTEVIFNYGSRESVSEKVLNVNDYFLETVSDVQILYNDKFSDRVPCDADKFPRTSKYLFASAKTYLPSKALNVSLENLSSSNAEVITLDESGFFNVKGLGTTTLTFGYFGKGEDGVYREMTITKDVTVISTGVEYVSILPSNNGIVNDSIEIGKSYTLSTFVSPSTESQEVTVTSSNPSCITAEIVKGEVVITGVAVGSSDITVTSASDPTKSVTRTYHVIKEASITGKTYHFTDGCEVYGYVLDIVFNEDGTGSLTETVFSTNKVFTDTFTYTLDGINIKFTAWSDSAPEQFRFDTGTVLANGKQVQIYNKEYYKTITSDMLE